MDPPLYTDRPRGDAGLSDPGEHEALGEAVLGHHELFPAHTGVMRCIAQPLRGSTTTKSASDSANTNTP